MKTLIKRWLAPTPKFFKKVIRIGLMLGAVSGIILLAPTAGIVLPAVVITAAQYAALAGSIAATIAKLTKEDFTGINWDALTEQKIRSIIKTYNLDKKLGINTDNIDIAELIKYIKEYVQSTK